MLMAYDDGGFKIKDVPMEAARVPLCSIDDRSAAEQILVWAHEHRPGTQWVIVGDGPFGVHEKS